MSAAASVGSPVGRAVASSVTVGGGGQAAAPGVDDYLRPASTDRYFRPDGTSLYKRPA